MNLSRMTGMRKLGQGAYSVAFELPERMVIKRGRASDGTRTFLEWCMWKRSKGEVMMGMPVVLCVEPVVKNIALGDYDEPYIAVLQRCDLTAREYIERILQRPMTGSDVTMDPDCPPYVKELARRFTEETGVFCDDMHGKNVMVCGTDWIVLDPSCGAYTRPEDWIINKQKKPEVRVVAAEELTEVQKFCNCEDCVAARQRVVRMGTMSIPEEFEPLALPALKTPVRIEPVVDRVRIRAVKKGEADRYLNEVIDFMEKYKPVMRPGFGERFMVNRFMRPWEINPFKQPLGP